MKTFMLIVSVLIFTKSYCQSSSSGDWVYLTTDSKEAKTYVKNKAVSIDRSNQTVKVWEKMTVPEQKLGDNVYTDPVFIFLTEMDCNMSRERTLSIVVYASDGQVILPQTETPNSEWSNIIPDTNGERIHNLACKMFFN